MVLTYKVDDGRLELPLQPLPARAVHRFGTTKPLGRRESAARSLTCADRCRVGGGAGAEDAKQEGATGWLLVGPPAWGPCRFHCLLACLPKITLVAAHAQHARLPRNERWRASQKQRGPAQSLMPCIDCTDIHAIISRRFHEHSTIH